MRIANRSLSCSIFLSACFSLLSVSASQAAVVESGHSAVWFDAARNGEGLTLQILDSKRAVLAWFTFDEDGGQRWLLDLGRIVRTDDDAYIEFPALTVTRGGRFGPNFNPDDVVRDVVGTATLRFEDCTSGTFSYSTFGLGNRLAVGICLAEHSRSHSPINRNRRLALLVANSCCSPNEESPPKAGSLTDGSLLRANHN